MSKYVFLLTVKHTLLCGMCRVILLGSPTKSDVSAAPLARDQLMYSWHLAAAKKWAGAVQLGCSTLKLSGERALGCVGSWCLGKNVSWHHCFSAASVPAADRLSDLWVQKMEWSHSCVVCAVKQCGGIGDTQTPSGQIGTLS